MSLIPGLEPTYCGKVRDVYDLGRELVIVATDRLSAFDVVFSEPIPDKGKVLSQLSAWWFQEQPAVAKLVPNHLITCDATRFPEPFRGHAALLAGRSMHVRKAKRVDYECVVRGYLSGSAWQEYRASGTVSGEPVAAGLAESARLPEPRFTPATKAAVGHDENISFARMANETGMDLAGRLRDATLALYRAAAAHAESRGLILADTKFEFGLDERGELLLIDEALTPDSSRYWFIARYQPGRPQEALDKQFVRDYLESLDWNKQPPPPPLPAEVILGTAERYREAFKLITGREYQ